MKGFCHTLIGVGPICDADCTVTFMLEAVIVQDQQGTPVLTGWREASGSRLWIIDLQPGEENLPSMPHDTNMATLLAYSAYDPPRVAALICYFHAAAGYPVRSTWLKCISAGSYSSWPGLTLANATKYWPSAAATIMGHLVAQRTRPIIPHTVDQPPPRVKKTPDIGPISRRMRSQTSAMANVITSSQAAQRQYQAQFLQSLAITVLD